MGGALVGAGGLRDGRAAEGYGVGPVGVQGVAVDRHVRDAVRADRADAAGAPDAAAAVGVGAGVVVDLDLAGDQGAIAAHAALDPHTRLVLGRRDELLGAGEGELHRP